jgi:hypothetical protein
MNQSYQQSTDKLPGDTNPLAPKILFDGEETLSMSSITAGYLASVSIPLPIDTDVSVLRPEAMAFRWDLGAGSFYDYPIPFTEVDTTTAGIRRNGELRISIDLKPTAYNLEIIIFDKTIQQSSLRVVWRILSTNFNS